MTVQEAIEILRDTPIDIRCTREDDIHTLYATAQEMAIEALNFVSEHHQSNIETYAHDMGVSLEQAERELRVEELSCSEKPNRSDLISRQAAIDALEEQLDYLDMLNKDENPTAGSKWYGVNWARNTIADLPSVQPDIIRCKDCKHRPVTNDNYDDDEWDCGFNIEFPDYKCPCRCEDGYYNRLPDDNWFCGNAERRSDG